MFDSNYSDTFTGQGECVPILLKQSSQPLSEQRYIVQVTFPTSGSGKIQSTSDTVDDIISRKAEWFDWSYGTVSTPYQVGLKYTPTAIRAYVVSGSMKMSISGR